MSASSLALTAEPDFDLVIAGGRVLDPETGLDAVREVGIAGGKVRAISPGPLRGRSRIDASGLAVAPGFIDLHSHVVDPAGLALRATDGVTAALELELGTAEVDRWYAEREGKCPIHFGVSVGHVPVRMKVKGDPPAFVPPASSRGAAEPATDAEVEAIRRGIEDGLERGALAVGFGIQYTGGASRWEVLEAFRAAARHGASCHVHMRYNGAREPASSTAALEEVLAAAAITGAPLHVVHLPSTSLGATARHLRMIEEARGRGLDVTTECYPYTAGMTDIASAVFDEGWRESMGIDYGDLEWAANGERLTAESFARLRKEGGMVAVHSIPEEVMLTCLRHPLVLVASDALMRDGKGHPRTTGTCARVLGRYVRETGDLSLLEAVAKLSLLPARRLERRAPLFRDKGRLREGADADIVVFDPARVIDRATFREPTLPPEGIRHVLVGGAAVVADGRLLPGVLPGRALRAPAR